jgi:gelsolin
VYIRKVKICRPRTGLLIAVIKINYCSSFQRQGEKMSAGLIQAKKYDWKDSNLAFFGSDTERQVKKSSAEEEPAWRNAGKKVGLQIWRIVKFKVTDWPTEDYGKFYGGDSYIILHTYKADAKSEALSYDLHFWIGSTSSQDEYGTAAYKTVELDTYLDDKPIQHREVQGHESAMFLSYFPKGIVIMEGGADSGFRHVAPHQYRPRLMHVHGEKKHIVISEIPMCRTRISSDDVYILDLGLTLYQWNGAACNKDERFKGMQVLNSIRSERGGKATAEVLEESDTAADQHPFYAALTGPDEAAYAGHRIDPNHQHQLYRVSDAETGRVQIKKVKVGPVSPKDLDRMDVFILDTGKDCFVWIGGGATPAERRNGFGYAHSHLMKTGHPLIPIIVVKEGQKNAEFSAALAA